MEYIAFIHDKTDAVTSKEQWASFFSLAKNSGLFLGGSEISKQIQIGEKAVPNITNSIGGFMLFESDNKIELLKLLQKHPIVIGGGTLELCEMPKSD